MAKIVTPDDALRRLEEMCAKAEHCESELRNKMLTWNIPTNDQQDILRALRERRFYDDHRFAKAYVKDKLRFSKWGRRKIEHGLMVKRIDAAIRHDAFAEIDQAEYYDTLMSLLHQRLRNDQELIESFEGRTKLFRFLAQRGFESTLISKAIKSLMKQ